MQTQECRDVARRVGEERARNEVAQRLLDATRAVVRMLLGHRERVVEHLI